MQHLSSGGWRRMMRMTARGFFFRYRIWVLKPSDYCIVKLSRTRVSNKRPGVQNGPGKEFSWTSWKRRRSACILDFELFFNTFESFSYWWRSSPQSFLFCSFSLFSVFLSFTRNVGVYNCVPTNSLALCCLVCEHIVPVSPRPYSRKWIKLTTLSLFLKFWVWWTRFVEYPFDWLQLNYETERLFISA